MAMSPGTYIKKRRLARGVSIEILATRISTEPRIAERDRAAWLRLIEADIVPIGEHVIDVLREQFPFDQNVLVALDEARRMPGMRAPRVCRRCACSQYDPCVETDSSAPGGVRGCAWVSADLCSSCPVDEPGEDAQPGPDDIDDGDQVPHPVNDQAVTGAAA